MFWSIVGWLGLTAQLPFLIPALAIGHGRLRGKVNWVRELRMARTITWARWLYIPATLAFSYSMIERSTPLWLLALDTALSLFLLFVFWHAGRDVFEEHEDLMALWKFEAIEEDRTRRALEGQ